MNYSRMSATALVCLIAGSFIPSTSRAATVVSPVTRAPHPYASMLFLDFILSEKGQRVFQAVNYLPAHPKIPAKQADLKPGGGRFKRALYFTPDSQFNEGNAWVEYFENNFMR